MKITIPLIFSFILVFVLNTAQATTQSAEEAVKNTADKVVARLNAERENLEAHPERIYDLVNELVIPHFDFVRMSKWVLGRNWRSASEMQQTQFVDEFRTLLVRTYARALLEYSEEEIVYLPAQNNPNSNIVVVRTKIQQPGSNSVPIDYSMHMSDGEWKAIDISIDGISLVATYRGSFASEIRKNGLDSLIKKLSERNNRLVSIASQ
ncbi:MAG: ABC transporter substrate-binding protein [Gammaproteobacteria bacterium]